MWIYYNLFIFYEWGYFFYLSKIMLSGPVDFSLFLCLLWFRFGSFLVCQGNQQYRIWGKYSQERNLGRLWNAKQNCLLFSVSIFFFKCYRKWRHRKETTTLTLLQKTIALYFKREKIISYGTVLFFYVKT